MHIFSGIYKGKALQSPKGLTTRPTAGRLRECLFNICQGLIEEEHFLDLFAGSGAMGFEALSRGAQSVTFVDSHAESIRCKQSNAKALGVEKQVKTYHSDVFKLLPKLVKMNACYGVIYVDPPYAIDKTEIPLSLQVLKYIDENCEVLLKTDGLLFLEDAVEAIPVDTILLNRLELKNSRQMGRSSLHQFSYRSQENQI